MPNGSRPDFVSSLPAQAATPGLRACSGVQISAREGELCSGAAGGGRRAEANLVCLEIGAVSSKHGESEVAAALWEALLGPASVSGSVRAAGRFFVPGSFGTPAFFPPASNPAPEWTESPDFPHVVSGSSPNAAPSRAVPAVARAELSGILFGAGLA